MPHLKIFLLYCCRAVGLFRLARYVTRKQLNILCYHGFSHQDEYLFRPKLYMCPVTFERRLDYLISRGYNFCSLGEALEKLDQNTLSDNSLVITVDDGWLSTYLLAYPLLKERQIPWTLYLTSYYVDAQIPVVNVAIQYLLWKSTLESLDVGKLIPGQEGVISCETDDDKGFLYEQLYQYCDQLSPPAERSKFIQRLADQLGVDAKPLLIGGLFNLITNEQCKMLAQDGVSIEWHTHRHRLPEENEQAMRDELDENAAWILANTGSKPQHLCYPSGRYNDNQLQWLAAYVGVLSATTCKPGLNTRNTPKLELNRFLDGEDIHSIVFEAEVSGFKSILRDWFGYVARFSLIGRAHDR